MQVSKSISWRSYPLKSLRNGPCRWISWLFGCFWRNQMTWTLVFFVFLWSTKSTHGLCTPISKRPRWCGAFDSSMDSLDSTKKGIYPHCFEEHKPNSQPCAHALAVSLSYPLCFAVFFFRIFTKFRWERQNLIHLVNSRVIKGPKLVILSETNSSHLKMDGWSRRSFPFRANGLISGCGFPGRVVGG